MVEISGKISKFEFQRLTLNDEIQEGLSVTRDPKNPRIAVIRTSDRISFKNCRRRWGWSSHLRHNLGPKEGISPLWFGTGIHFALEDFHGYNRFGHPKAAFEAYVRARIDHDPQRLPEDYKELTKLGQDMMDYYVLWLQQRKNTILKTYWHEGVPQVEVNFRFDIPIDQKFLDMGGYDKAVYSGTIDRICVDENGWLWPMDYKTAAQIATLHYATDPQIGVYMWAMPHLYAGKTIGGFYYQQHKKKVPLPGRILQNGSVSTDKSQDSSRLMYRETLISVYGSVENAPEKNQELLNQFAMQEDEWQDNFIRIDKVYRNERAAQSEGVKILMELEDMLNPDLPLYPNPTRDCAQFCPFHSPCVSMDDGSDYKHILSTVMEPREAVYDSWRVKIKWPSDGESVEKVKIEAPDDSFLNFDN